MLMGVFGAVLMCVGVLVRDVLVFVSGVGVAVLDVVVLVFVGVRPVVGVL